MSKINQYSNRYKILVNRLSLQQMAYTASFQKNPILNQLERQTETFFHELTQYVHHQFLRLARPPGHVHICYSLPLLFRLHDLIRPKNFIFQRPA